jgi:hypothetical protein
VHPRADVHETPVRAALGASIGVGSTAQLAPSHLSTSTLPRADPTATHNLRDGHDMASNAPTDP